MNEPRPELVQMVKSGRLAPCSAIDLGCGTGDNAIFLANNGFDVIGVDLSQNAISQAKERALSSGSPAKFMVGNVTNLTGISGVFDLVLDFGCLGCVIGTVAREKYKETLLQLTRSGSIYILLNFAKNPKSKFNLVPNALAVGEVDRLLGENFETLEFNQDDVSGPLGLSIEFRLMQRK